MMRFEAPGQGRDNYWAVAVLMAIVVGFRLLIITAAGMKETWTGFLDPTPAFLFVLAGVVLLYATIRDMPWFSAPARALLLALLLSSYLPESNEAALHLARDIPYADGALARADATLGLDWLAYLGWLDAHPLLWSLCHFGYASIWLQVLAAGPVLMLLRSHHRLCTFFGAQAVCLAVTCVLGAAFPAVGAYVHYGVRDLGTINDMTHTVAANMLPCLEWARAADWAPTPAGAYHGVVSFPSYHAICCTTCVWAYWPIRWLRWPVVVMNVAMLASTPIMGAHYFVDLIAGIAIAGAAIAAVGALTRSTWVRNLAARPSRVVQRSLGAVP